MSMRNSLLNNYIFVGLFQIFFYDNFFMIKEEFVLKAPTYSKKLSIFQRPSRRYNWEKLVFNISDFRGKGGQNDTYSTYLTKRYRQDMSRALIFILSIHLTIRNMPHAVSPLLFSTLLFFFLQPFPISLSCALYLLLVTFIFLLLLVLSLPLYLNIFLLSYRFFIAFILLFHSLYSFSSRNFFGIFYSLYSSLFLHIVSLFSFSSSLAR